MSAGLDPHREDSSELITNIEIEEDCPLRITGSEEKGYFITMGKYRVSKIFPIIELADREAREKSWYTILNIIGVIMITHEASLQSPPDTNK